ncbi:hypothetical protein POM88_045800 [Heracleum sosnowskyi]|uniref:GAG-pre-integrase domain-containing protein n=1 Tax=Heracleum sosnowskyi TaxID=360622 RepID=A0AAD8H6L7_9APIA|nr:hypothetical protein POM88_045800 [Heracleum sosnowskyi]
MAECDVKASQGIIMLNETCVVPELKRDREKVVESSTWYLDNGASNHMSRQRSKFAELDESVTGEVRFWDGSAIRIEGKGSIVFNCKNGEKWRLQEVYYIPSLRSNIITLGQLSEEGNKVVVQGEYLWVNDKQGKLLMKVKREVNRLYKIDIEDSKPLCLLTKTEENSWLWHSRLGHVNFAALTLMSKENMAYGLPRIVQLKKVCEGCLMSKQVRKSFPSKSEFSSTTTLELVHGDICGPFTPPTPAGNRYFLLLVDDFSSQFILLWMHQGQSFVQVLQNEGAKSLYRGLTHALMRSVLYGGLHLGLYEPSKYVCDLAFESNNILMKIASGAFSGALATALTNPSERTNRGVAENIFNGGNDYSLEGSWSCNGAALTASQLATYDESKQVLTRWTRREEGFYLHLFIVIIMLPAPWTTTILFKNPFVADYVSSHLNNIDASDDFCIELDFPVVPLIDYTSVGLSTISQSLNGASILDIKKTTIEDDLLLNVASSSTTFNKIEVTVSSDPLDLSFFNDSILPQTGYLVML